MAVAGVSVVVVLGIVAAVAVVVAAGATLARLLRERRAPEVLRVDAGPIERVYRADRPTLADEVLDGATRVRGTHIVRDRETGVLLQVRGSGLADGADVDLYVHVELPSDGARTSYVLTAQAVDPLDGGRAEAALQAFEAHLRTAIGRSSGMEAIPGEGT